MTPLERRYRRLLKSYPYDDRQRVEEILATLLAAAPAGQRHPTINGSVDLIANGFRERARRFGRGERAAARQWTGLIAVAGLSAIVALVLTVHLTGSWSTPLPWMFLPVWIAIGALPVAHMWRTPRRPILDVVPLGAVVVGLVLGAEQTLVQRTLLIAVGFLSLLVISTGAIRPDRRSRVVAVTVGAGVGMIGAIRVASNLGRLPLESRQRQAIVLRSIFHIPAVAGWVWPVAICAIAVVTWLKPSVSIVASTLSIPAVLALSVLAHDGRITDTGQTILRVSETVLWAIMTLSVGTARTLSRRPRQPG